MKRKPIDQLLACGLSFLLATTPVLSPISAYAEEREGNTSEPALLGIEGDGEQTYGEDAYANETLIGEGLSDEDANSTDSGESELMSLDELGQNDENQTALPDNGAEDEATPNEEQAANETIASESNLTSAEENLTTQVDESSDSVKTAGEETPKAEATLSASARLKDGSWSTAQKVSVGKTVRLGKSTMLKGLKLKLVSLKNTTGSIQYRAFVTDKGWTAWKADGANAAISAKQLEAVEVKLTGELAKTFAIEYRAYVKGQGWLGWTSNGRIAGTVGFDDAMQALELRLVDLSAGGSAAAASNAGKSAGIVANGYQQKNGWLETKTGLTVAIGKSKSGLRLEAIKLKVFVGDLTGSIYYNTFAKNEGWLGEGLDGKRSGTVGENLAIEAVKMRVDDQVRQAYDLYYRVYVNGLGWMAWASNGEKAGAPGFSKQVEAMQITLVRRGSGAPSIKPKSATKAAYVSSSEGSVCYVSMLNKKLQDKERDGDTSGNSSTKITGIKVDLEELSDLGGDIRYKVYQTGKKWSKWTTDNKLAGNKRNAVECLRIDLTGKVSKLYNVWYRVKADGYGWLGWASNGQESGSEGGNIPIVAYQVKILPKGKTPGSTSRRTVPKVEINMTKRAQSISSPTRFLIMVDDHNCVVGVYKGKRNAWTRVKFSRCGTPNGNAVAGKFYVKQKHYSAGGGGYIEYYVTEGLGSGSFHSILCVPGTFKPLYAESHQLRAHESHGCYRLPLSMARYIYENVPANSAQCVYNVY